MMLLESGANRITVTLNELKTLDSPEYVLILVNDSTKKKIACKLGTELSEYPERSNQFTVTVKSGPVALNSEVTLSAGFHKYFIYEKADADAFDFAGVDDMDLREIEGEVENGKAFYSVTASETAYYKDRPSSIKSY